MEIDKVRGLLKLKYREDSGVISEVENVDIDGESITSARTHVRSSFPSFATHPVTGSRTSYPIKNIPPIIIENSQTTPISNRVDTSVAISSVENEGLKHEKQESERKEQNVEKQERIEKEIQLKNEREIQEEKKEKNKNYSSLNNIKKLKF